jgi:hypothetical protein
LDLDQIQLEPAPPDDKLYAEPLFGFQVTGGSSSVRGAWEPLRRAGATARNLLVSAAAETWEVDAAACRAEHGAVIHLPTGRTLTYGALVEKAATLPVPSHVALKDRKDFKLIGTPARPACGSVTAPRIRRGPPQHSACGPIQRCKIARNVTAYASWVPPFIEVGSGYERQARRVRFRRRVFQWRWHSGARFPARH